MITRAEAPTCDQVGTRTARRPSTMPVRTKLTTMRATALVLWVTRPAITPLRAASQRDSMARRNNPARRCAGHLHEVGRDEPRPAEEQAEARQHGRERGDHRHEGATPPSPGIAPNITQVMGTRLMLKVDDTTVTIGRHVPRKSLGRKTNRHKPDVGRTLGPGAVLSGESSERSFSAGHGASQSGPVHHRRGRRRVLRLFLDVRLPQAVHRGDLSGRAGLALHPRLQDRPDPGPRWPATPCPSSSACE